MAGHSAQQAALPGMEAGRRTERVEWGLRSTASDFLHRKGDVTPRVSEQHARECAVTGLGWGAIEIVQRTVVTYTTPWEMVPGDGMLASMPGAKDGTDG